MVTSMDICGMYQPRWYNFQREKPCLDFMCLADKYRLYEERPWFLNDHQIPICEMKAIRAFSCMYKRLFKIPNLYPFYNEDSLIRLGLVLRDLGSMIHCDDKREHTENLWRNVVERQHALHELDYTQTLNYMILRIIFDATHYDAMDYASCWEWLNEDRRVPTDNFLSKCYNKEDYRLGDIDPKPDSKRILEDEHEDKDIEISASNKKHCAIA